MFLTAIVKRSPTTERPVDHGPAGRLAERISNERRCDRFAAAASDSTNEHAAIVPERQKYCRRCPISECRSGRD